MAQRSTTQREVRTKQVTYGYARVSTRDQNLVRQIDALEAFGVERACIFADKASGKDFHRPTYQRLVRRLHTGNTVVIKSIDRLGRNYDEILEEWRRLTKNSCAHLVVLDMPLLDTRGQTGLGEDVTRTFISDLLLQLLSYVAQVERENIKRRQAEGIAAARARGMRFGRPEKPLPEGALEMFAAVRAGEVSKTEAARRLGVCRRTLDKWLAREQG